jgi:hypothetical protein
LTSETYNSYWDIKTEEKTLGKTIEPILMLNHYFKINDHSNLNSCDGSVRQNRQTILIIKMPTVQIQLILKNYLVIIVPCMAKTRENIRVLTPDNENAEESPSVFSKPSN